MIYAGLPFFVLGSQDGRIPTFWLLLCLIPPSKAFQRDQKNYKVGAKYHITKEEGPSTISYYISPYSWGPLPYPTTFQIKYGRFQNPGALAQIPNSKGPRCKDTHKEHPQFIETDLIRYMDHVLLRS